jgi:hypothetical protein
MMRRKHTRLSIDPREPIDIIRQRARQHLDGNIAHQFAVSGAVHLAHPPEPTKSTTRYPAMSRPIIDASGRRA